jgi:secreted trypsin-like serine protease
MSAKSWVIGLALLVADSEAGAIYKGASTTHHPEVAFVGASCSGVAVGPQTVLTSWHCRNATWVAIDGYVRKGHTVVQLGGIDLAYLCLMEPQTMPVASPTPAALKDGARVTVAGYGESERLTYEQMIAKRRQLETQISDEKFNPGIFITAMVKGLLKEGSSKISTTGAHPLLDPDPSVPCVGDSGGPVYVPGTLKLLGIVDEYAPPSGSAVCGNSIRYIDMTSRTDLIAQAKKACGD